MKEIKAFIHRGRVADVVHALKQAGFRGVSVVDVEGMLKALDLQEERYSIAIGEQVITEAKLELVCEADQVDRAVAIIRAGARTGQPTAGWVYVSDVEAAYEIDGEERRDGARLESGSTRMSHALDHGAEERS